MELELKLQMSPESMKALMGASWLRALQTGPTRTKQLKATYFDTPAHDLRNAGCALRVRREGRRNIQCLKSRTSSSALLAREEHELVVRTVRPDLEVLKAMKPLAALSPEIWPAIQPLFTTDIRRTVKQVQQDQTLVEISFDQGTILAGKKSTPICETELELIDGEPQSLLDLARQIVETVPCQLIRHGKADAGYDLLDANIATWTRAGSLVLPENCSAEEAMAEICQHSLSHLQANECCVLAGTHPEGVHQMRVAVRRLRSLLSVYKSLLPQDQREALNRELSWLGQSLSPARDWDVFLDETLAAVQQDMETEHSLECLRSLARKQRELAYQLARDAITSKRYTHLVLRLTAWHEAREWRQQQLSEKALKLFAPAMDFASSLLRERQRSLRKRGRAFTKLNPQVRHDLRISAKKLRYATEFFSSLLEVKASANYLQALARLQDDLGQFNDVIVARQLLDALIADADAADRGAVNYAAGLVMGWHHHLAHGLKSRQEKSWNRFKKATLSWQ